MEGKPPSRGAVPLWGRGLVLGDAPQKARDPELGTGGAHGAQVAAAPAGPRLEADWGPGPLRDGGKEALFRVGGHAANAGGRGQPAAAL